MLGKSLILLFALRINHKLSTKFFLAKLHLVICHESIDERLVHWESVDVGCSDAFHALRVRLNSNVLLVVAHQIVVKLESPGFFLFHDQFAHFQEVIRHLRVVIVELGTTFAAAVRLEGLNNQQKFFDQFTALDHQLVLIQMNVELVSLLFVLKSNDFLLLVLVDELGNHKCTLRVGLTPLFGFSIVKLQAKDALSQLVHDIAPQHDGHFFILNAEQSVHFRKRAQEVSASVGSALFVAGGDGAELRVPSVIFLVAALNSLSCDRIDK